MIVTVHDLIPLVLPGHHRSRSSALYTRLMAHAVRDAEAIITVSEHSKRDIIRLLQIPEHRIHVTLEAADSRFSPSGSPGETDTLRERYELPERYLLYIGGSEKRKNLETLVRAWHAVENAMKDLETHLVIIARFPPPDSLYPDIPGFARELGVKNVRFLSKIDEVDKPAVYRCALGLCFPSMYEGFGLTPLEAMASGIPVICSNATSLPEVVNEAAWLLDPQDVRAWSDAMKELVISSDKRRQMSEKSLSRASAFSWRRTAEETVAVYRSVIAR
ncbi:MAG: hypothetical protein NVSMB52_16040 [Chloroflexota bacterium]